MLLILTLLKRNWVCRVLSLRDVPSTTPGRLQSYPIPRWSRYHVWVSSLNVFFTWTLQNAQRDCRVFTALVGVSWKNKIDEQVIKQFLTCMSCLVLKEPLKTSRQQIVSRNVSKPLITYKFYRSCWYRWALFEMICELLSIPLVFLM